MGHDLLQFLLILLFAIVTVFTGFLGVDFNVCHECTRTPKRKNRHPRYLECRFW